MDVGKNNKREGDLDQSQSGSGRPHMSLSLSLSFFSLFRFHLFLLLLLLLLPLQLNSSLSSFFLIRDGACRLGGVSIRLDSNLQGEREKQWISPSLPLLKQRKRSRSLVSITTLPILTATRETSRPSRKNERASNFFCPVRALSSFFFLGWFEVGKLCES